MRTFISVYLAIFFISFTALAQDHENNIFISGKITDNSTGQPLAGANVYVKGTHIGTSADTSGIYEIRIPAGSELTVSYTGYEPIQVIVNKDKTWNVALSRKVIYLKYEEIPDANNIASLKDAEGKVYIPDEQLPAFPGGQMGFQKFIEQHTPRPDAFVNGDVYVNFTINENGFPEQIWVRRSLDPVLDSLAIRVISESPQWKPGMQNGKPVKVECTIPVSFVNEELYFITDEMPKFNGSEFGFRDYIQKNLNYPKDAYEKGIQGRVFIKFVVNQNGDVCNVKLAKGCHPLLDNESLRVVSSSPKWTPGKANGKNVAVQFTFPIVFSIPK